MIISLNRIFLVLLLSFSCVHPASLLAQSEGQAGEEVLLLENQLKPQRTIEIRTGDRIVYPESSDPGAPKQVVEVTGIEDSSLFVRAEGENGTYSLRLRDYPYVQHQRRGIRKAFRILGFTDLAVLVGGLLATLIMAFTATGTFASLTVAVFFLVTLALAVPIGIAALVLFFLMRRKIWLKEWRIRKVRRRPN